uniref:Uncharacterized protein n=1 Tax=viral metagenome TaxID=1070528 RepID=A0A6M3LHY0_9ZZZZ
MRTITAQGSYTSPISQKEVNFDFSYLAFDSADDIVSNSSEAKLVKDYNRMSKLDASNTARESAKVANGDSTRKPLTEEEKSANKAERKTNSEIIKLLKAKGLSLSDIENL